MKSSPFPHRSHDFGGFRSEKNSKNIFLCVFFRHAFLYLGVIFLHKISCFIRTYGFTSIKLIFSHDESLVSPRPVGLQNGKMPSVFQKWGSRARVVLILEEELEGFLYVSFIWWFGRQKHTFPQPMVLPQ